MLVDLHHLNQLIRESIEHRMAIVVAAIIVQAIIVLAIILVAIIVAAIAVDIVPVAVIHQAAGYGLNFFYIFPNI